MPADLQDILRIEIPLVVQIASRAMALEEVMNLAPGAIIELPKLADEELEIMIGAKQIGLGRAVKVGENFGIRVSFIGDVRARIAAMAGPRCQRLTERHPDELSGGSSFGGW